MTPLRKTKSASSFPPAAYARSATHQPSLNVSSGSFPPAIGRSRGAAFASCALIGGARRQSALVPSAATLVGSPPSSFSRRWVGAAVLASHVRRNSCFVFDARVAASLQPEGPHSGVATPLNSNPVFRRVKV